jgi:type IV secretion system protein TrbE
MLNLAEYKRNPTCLSDYLPWACLVAPGIVLNKDGSFQRTFRYRGPDLDSATEAELVSISARLNNILKRFGDGWALFFDAARVSADRYPGARFADAASWLVDEERRSDFQAESVHYESRYFLTFLYLPPPERTRRAEQLFYQRPDDDRFDTQTFAHHSWFETETDRAFELLSALLPEVEALDDAETLAYLHGTISGKRHPVAVPTIPTHLDAVLCDTPLTGGTHPKLGDAHLRLLTILGFPNTTSPGLLDALNDLGFSYRWSTRWIALDKTEANKHLGRLRRHWFSKRKSIGALLREVMFNRETVLLDPDADAKALDADEAMQELGSDDVAFGYITTTIVVADADEARANGKLLAVERIINGRGFTTIRETLNAVEAWLGSLPGNPYANIRQPIVHTLNLVHLMPVSAVWAGPESNRHLNAPPLMLTETRGSTPFRLDLHIGDVGHTLIVGPTGAGKSVLLALLALQFRRFIGARVAIFDRGRSARAAVLAMTGTAIDLGLDGTISLQPLARITEPAEMAFALDWVMGLIAAEGLKATPEIKDTVWTALQSLASAPKAQRTLTGLAVLVQSSAVVAALQPYTLEGAYGRLLDGAAETLVTSDVLHIEMENLMGHKALMRPVLTYLFHRLEAQFDGRPTLLIIDEAWTFLDDPQFSARIREWLKTLRKKNVAVVFATQSLADIERSPIAPALIEACMTRIFLPHDRALEPQARATYARFGLNDRQVQILATATPKRHYYAQTARGNRLFELGLGPVAMALCGAGSPDDQRLIDRLTAAVPRTDFADAFLRAKGLDWAADALGAFPGRSVVPTETGEEPVSRPVPSPVPDPEPQPEVLPEPQSDPEPILDLPLPRTVAPAPAPLDFDLLTQLPERLSPYRAVPKPNRAARRKTAHAVKGLVIALMMAPLTAGLPPRSAHAIIVFDPANYQQNLLTAARALEEINNQIRQLTAQAEEIQRMDQNLQQLGSTISPDLQATLTQLKAQLQAGQGLALSVQQTEANYAQMYPSQLSNALTMDQVLVNAKTRWQQAYAALQKSALLQGEVADSIGTDTGVLNTAMARSQGATGALSATQAGNELTALGVKQALQLQGLLAAQARAQTLQQARDLATEDEARQRFTRFVGTGTGYTAGH